MAQAVRKREEAKEKEGADRAERVLMLQSIDVDEERRKAERYGCLHLFDNFYLKSPDGCFGLGVRQRPGSGPRKKRRWTTRKRSGTRTRVRTSNQISLD